MVYGAGASAAIAAAIAQAIKASGAIVRMEPDDFLQILSRTERPLVVIAKGGVIKANYRYLTGYKGLAFYTKSSIPLMLPGNVEVVMSKEIWIPG